MRIGSPGGWSQLIGVAHAAFGTLKYREALTAVAQEGVVTTVPDDGDRRAGSVVAWLPHLAACAGVPPPLHMPTWPARALAGAMAVAMMTQGRGFTNTKAKQQLGWVPRHPSWREGFAGALA